jgi:hypothetical protein
MDQLASEDSLRLNVLLAQPLQAVRIDESRMVVYALSAQGEAKVPLNPNCKEQAYLRRVRQILSSHVLGSPGGYPLYLRRWTRMGQARDESLEKLLLLGEPEAVSAVVHAPGLTDELARRAWWTEQSAEHARCMLKRDGVAKGEMGPVLAEFLIEFLPFESDHQAMIDSIRLVLQPGLIDASQRQHLWEQARRKNSYYVGFLEAIPEALPVHAPSHPDRAKTERRLRPLLDRGNPFALQLCRVLSAQGQAFLHTAELALRKPNNQDVVVALLEVIGDYFGPVRVDELKRRSIDIIEKDVRHVLQEPGATEALAAVLELMPETRERLAAMLVLSMYGEQLVAPIFGLTDAIGSVMRKRIAPITEYTKRQLATLIHV